jgi:hypothetical protein
LIGGWCPFVVHCLSVCRPPLVMPLVDKGRASPTPTTGGGLDDGRAGCLRQGGL